MKMVSLTDEEALFLMDALTKMVKVESANARASMTYQFTNNKMRDKAQAKVRTISEIMVKLT